MNGDLYDGEWFQDRAHGYGPLNVLLSVLRDVKRKLSPLPRVLLSSLYWSIPVYIYENREFFSSFFQRMAEQRIV